MFFFHLFNERESFSLKYILILPINQAGFQRKMSGPITLIWYEIVFSLKDAPVQGKLQEAFIPE